MGKITIKFKNGKMDTDMEGYKGEQCTEAMKKYLAERLTEGAEVENKSEFYDISVTAEEVGYNAF